MTSRLTVNKAAAREAKATVRVLADAGKAYAIYINGGIEAELTVELPEGKYQAEWVDPDNGKVMKVENLETDGGPRVLSLSGYEEDVAVRVTRREK